MSPQGAFDEGDGRFLLVRSADLFCALPAANVRRIARDLTAHPLPGGKPHLSGLAQYGGEPLAVLDLRALVTGDEPSAVSRTTVIVMPRLTPAPARLGLGVDEAIEVVTIATGLSAAAGSWPVAGWTRRGGREVAVIDLEAVFSDGAEVEESPHA